MGRQRLSQHFLAKMYQIIFFIFSFYLVGDGFDFEATWCQMGLIPLSYQANNVESKVVLRIMRFDCERSEAALFDSGVRKAAFYVGGLLLPREVFWKRILAKSRSLRRCGFQCERVRPNNAEGKAKQCIGVMMFFCSILLRFLNRTCQNAEIRHSV